MIVSQIKTMSWLLNHPVLIAAVYSFRDYVQVFKTWPLAEQKITSVQCDSHVKALSLNAPGDQLMEGNIPVSRLHNLELKTSEFHWAIDVSTKN